MALARNRLKIRGRCLYNRENNPHKLNLRLVINRDDASNIDKLSEGYFCQILMQLTISIEL